MTGVTARSAARRGRRARDNVENEDRNNMTQRLESKTTTRTAAALERAQRAAALIPLSSSSSSSSSSSKPFWALPSLLQAVVHASVESQVSWQVEQERGSILRSIRQLLQQQQGTTDGTLDNDDLDRYCLVLHALRAVAPPAPLSSSTAYHKDAMTMLRLLPFVVQQLCANPTPRSGYYAAVAHELLGQVVVAAFYCDDFDDVTHFPIPNGRNDQDAAHLVSVATAAIQSCQALLRVLFTSNELEEEEFGAAAWLIPSWNATELGRLTRHVFIPWLQFLARHEAGTTAAYSYGKALYKMLWQHAAASLEGVAAALELRRTSLQVLLFWNDQDAATAPLTSRQQQHLATACTQACQAALLHRQAKKNDQTWIDFYQDMDAILAPANALVAGQEWRTQYREFCCHRAVHTGFVMPATARQATDEPALLEAGLMLGVRIQQQLLNDRSLPADAHNTLATLTQHWAVQSRRRSRTPDENETLDRFAKIYAHLDLAATVAKFPATRLATQFLWHVVAPMQWTQLQRPKKKQWDAWADTVLAAAGHVEPEDMQRVVADLCQNDQVPLRVMERVAKVSEVKVVVVGHFLHNSYTVLSSACRHWAVHAPLKGT
jgi:hypothetical protein